jgi:hypothetical protein
MGAQLLGQTRTERPMLNSSFRRSPLRSCAGLADPGGVLDAFAQADTDQLINDS